LLRRESGYGGRTRAATAVVGRWTLGSGVLAPALNLADPHWLLARSGDLCRPDLHTDSPRNNANTVCRKTNYYFGQCIVLVLPLPKVGAIIWTRPVTCWVTFDGARSSTLAKPNHY